MSRTLLLLRHAKSDWSQRLEDRQRPLNARGRKAAPRMGRLLADLDLLPEIILSSNAVRAVQTTELFVEESAYQGPIEYYDRLYLAEPETYLDVLTDVPPGTHRVLMVGHNPGISNLASLLTGKECEMPTAALCQIELDTQELNGVHSASPGKLLGFWKPKEL